MKLSSERFVVLTPKYAKFLLSFPGEFSMLDKDEHRLYFRYQLRHCAYLFIILKEHVSDPYLWSLSHPRLKCDDNPDMIGCDELVKIFVNDLAGGT